MGSLNYIYSSDVFTSVKSQGFTGDQEQQLFENMVSENGQFCLLTNFNTIDENGFYFDLSATFAIYTDETDISNVLELLSAEQMTIISEIYPYNYSGPDLADYAFILYSNGNNGLPDPTTVEVEIETFLGIADYYTYQISYDQNEINGLTNKFGYAGESTVTELINEMVASIADTVVNSYRSKRYVFKRGPRIQIDPLDYGDISPINLAALSDQTEDVPTTSTPVATVTTAGTSTGGGY